jgi:hypothetical protein
MDGVIRGRKCLKDMVRPSGRFQNFDKRSTPR